MYKINSLQYDSTKNVHKSAYIKIEVMKQPSAHEFAMCHWLGVPERPQTQHTTMLQTHYCTGIVPR